MKIKGKAIKFKWKCLQRRQNCAIPRWAGTAVRNYGRSNLYLRTVKINVYIFCGVMAAEECGVRCASVFIMQRLRRR